jgi:GDP-4-dehydro-6-deoxy-D-mannose reductase
VEIALGRREPILRVGNLDSVRDFLDVHDVVEAYARLGGSDKGDAAAGIYNVATGVGVRIGDALETILRIAGVSPRVEPDPARVRPTDHTVGDSERLRRATGWTPQVSFDDTLASVVEDWRERLSAA